MSVSVQVLKMEKERGKNRKCKIDCFTHRWKELNGTNTWCEWSWCGVGRAGNPRLSGNREIVAG